MKKHVGQDIQAWSVGGVFIRIGVLFDGAVFGLRLSEALSHGPQKKWCFANEHGKLIKGFWPRYVAGGRCSFDRRHVMSFYDERWKTGPRVRECLWCGLKQKRVVERKVVRVDRWETIR